MAQTTLVIKHMPHSLNDAEKNDFLKHFGAKEVKVINSKVKKSNLVFALFENKTQADLAVKRLHQLPMLGYTLSVEYANHLSDSTELPEHDQTKNFKNNLTAFLSRLHSFNNSVDFLQPPHPHLKYRYPAPNKSTLSNIVHYLETIPKFYTQVVHLMNKLNLPPPFCEDISTQVPALLPQQAFETIIHPPLPPELEMCTSSDESEIESDPDEPKIENIVPHKRKFVQTFPDIKKRLKFLKIEPSLSKPSSQKMTTDEVFEKTTDVDHLHRKIELKLSNAFQVPANMDKQFQESEVGCFGKIYPNKNIEKVDSGNIMEEYTKSSSQSEYITPEELAANRINEKDYHLLPAFKNYNAGPPSCRIYIKNLAKSVTEEDLNFIYKKYINIGNDDNDEQQNIYDVRLMHEGRMKEQAFITFKNVEQAQIAVKETNGFILKDKPMAVVFARSAMIKPK